MPPTKPRLRALTAADQREIPLIARRMRRTLMEVVGADRGQAMYSLAWLEDRVRWHLDPACCTGAVFVAEDGAGLLGHTIVRIETDEGGQPMGLFSTTYVDPAARRCGVADALLAQGEAWMREQGMPMAATHTSATNAPLIRLYERRGYKIVMQIAQDNMIRLGKVLSSVDD